MTDYLEQEEQADVLLEALRRLSDWTGGGAREELNAPETPLLRATQTMERTEAQARRTQNTSGGEGAVSAPWTEPDSGREPWTGIPGRPALAEPMDGMRQAEELDALFRRDMRRYDSGFFLY